jgi:hypothetical protein
MTEYAWEIDATEEVDTKEPSVNNPGTTHKYRRGVSYIVMARDLQEACNKLIDKHPDLVLIKVFRSRNITSLIP